MLAALRYAWAAPATLVGLVAALAAVLLGARGTFVEGVLEVSGGRLGRAISRLPALRFSAITLGHVVLGTSPGLLAVVRRHEQAHVRQYERWGPLFFPLYAGASLLAWLAARDPYWHNHFECQARREAGEEAEVPVGLRGPARVAADERHGAASRCDGGAGTSEPKPLRPGGLVASGTCPPRRRASIAGKRHAR